ncbi:sulfotransferase domain-containing protein [Micromonospora sp. WMMA1923]|uniref:sulfotransferase domain-containing protein n=1 Tax=Micromonospora sp. WMMA1923 TaxID=3404125 RepID=UPI003B940A2E
MSAAPFRYRSPDEDSARWLDFPFRDGDIVISTRSKSGTTWLQMICALLVLRTPELPAPLSRLSPWLDWLVEPTGEVFARLAAQRHRRFVKTHTPLDGLPLDPRVTYVVVGRHPLDLAVSLYHQTGNLNRQRLRELTGEPAPAGPPRAATPVGDWLAEWIDRQPDPRTELDSLPGVLWHLGDAWQRRGQPNVVLVHYADLLADLPGQMRRLADRLGLVVPDEQWPALVEAATFTRMRERADRLAPDPVGVLRSRDAFFRHGGSGQGQALLDDAALARYRARVAGLAPPDLTAWLHR